MKIRKQSFRFAAPKPQQPVKRKPKPVAKPVPAVDPVDEPEQDARANNKEQEATAKKAKAGKLPTRIKSKESKPADPTQQAGSRKRGVTITSGTGRSPTAPSEEDEKRADPPQATTSAKPISTQSPGKQKRQSATSGSKQRSARTGGAPVPTTPAARRRARRATAPAANGPSSKSSDTLSSSATSPPQTPPSSATNTTSRITAAGAPSAPTRGGRGVLSGVTLPGRKPVSPVESGPAGLGHTVTPSTTTTPTSSTISKTPGTSTSATHLIVKALAGTGKTTSLIEGMKAVRGLPTLITPSGQQAAIWEAMKLGRNSSIRFAAFGNAIAAELGERLEAAGLNTMGCEATTMHKMGFKAVNKQFGYQEPNKYVVGDIIGRLLGRSSKDLLRDKPVLLTATEDLVSMCKLNLARSDRESLDRLSSYYDIDLDEYRNEVYDLVPRVLEVCREPKGQINFDDMVWLPVELGLPIYKTDVLLGDESQDWNKVQQALALKAGHRLILVGDKNQAIFGFAGADTESMERMEKHLSGTPMGCMTLPLTVTRRCGRAIVNEARRIVPNFEAHPSNCDGLIRDACYPTRESGREVPYKDTYLPLVQDGDMIICRCVAPAVGQCFRLIKEGHRANVLGRDIGTGIIKTIDKLKAESVPDLVAKMNAWVEKETETEQAKTHPSEMRLASIQDKFECLMCFTEGAATVDAVKERIDKIFTANSKSPGVRLSTIHKAKGLEARRVFFLMPKGAGCPHPMARTAWQQEQERHLLYVGITRAIEELTYVK